MKHEVSDEFNLKSGKMKNQNRFFFRDSGRGHRIFSEFEISVGETCSQHVGYTSELVKTSALSFCGYEFLEQVGDVVEQLGKIVSNSAMWKLFAGLGTCW